MAGNEKVGPGLSLFHQSPRRIAQVENLSADSTEPSPAALITYDDALKETDANVITSLSATGNAAPHFAMHRPVIDIDFPVAVRESSPGKSHLFIDYPMTWSEYQELLRVMVSIGIVESGYLSASTERGYTAVRLPWIEKEQLPQPATGLMDF